MEKILLELKELKMIMLLQKEVLTIDEVSLYTGYTRDYIYKLVHLKQIPSSKPHYGRKLFFNKSELIGWLTSNKQLSNEELDKKASDYLVKKSLKC